MRSSEKRVKLEKGFAYSYESPVQVAIVDYLELRKDQLINSLTTVKGEDLITLKGELTTILKLISLLKKPESL